MSHRELWTADRQVPRLATMSLRQVLVVAATTCFALAPPAAAETHAASQAVPSISTELKAVAGQGVESQEILALTSAQAGFGGMWVDPEGLIHLAVQPNHRDEIEELLGDKFKGVYVIDTVQNSYEQLIDRRDAISNQMTQLGSKGLKLMEWGPDEHHNTIWISLVDYSESKAALARHILGEDVIVKPSLTNGGPW